MGRGGVLVREGPAGSLGGKSAFPFCHVGCIKALGAIASATPHGKQCPGVELLDVAQAACWLRLRASSRRRNERVLDLQPHSCVVGGTMADPMALDTAMQCVDKAKAAMLQRDWDTAIRLLERSMRVAGTAVAGADVLLRHCNKSLARQRKEAEAAAAEARAAADAASARRRAADRSARASAAPAPRPSVARSSPPPSPVEDTSTPEQRELVNHVLAAKSLWAVLGVEERAPGSAVKKAFRKLALRMHPDKNPAPRAKEAFQRVNHAFTVLNDADSRELYERTGDDGTEATRQPTQPNVVRRRGFARARGGMGHEADFDDFVREAFFGGFAPGGNGFEFRFGRGADPRGRAGQHHHAQAEAEEGQEETPQIAKLLQFLPLLLMLVLAIGAFPSSMRSEPSFSFVPSIHLNKEMHTKSSGVVGNVRYYVKPDTWQTLHQSYVERSRFEAQVQQSRFNDLRQACSDEEHEIRKLKWEHQYSFGHRRAAIARRLKTLSSRRCDEFREFAAMAQRARGLAGS